MTLESSGLPLPSSGTPALTFTIQRLLPDLGHCNMALGLPSVSMERASEGLPFFAPLALFYFSGGTSWIWFLIHCPSLVHVGHPYSGLARE